MKTRLVQVGNSLGVRIPKPLIEESGLEGEVEMVARSGAILIRNVQQPRDGWARAFDDMAKHSDDALLDPDSAPVRWDREEWRW